MERFKNILIFAGNKMDIHGALKQAVSLAKKNEAKLKVVDVVKETVNYGPILPSAIKDLNLHDILEQEKREDLERLVLPYKDSGVKIAIKILSGTAFLELIAEVIRKEHDLLITGVEGKSEFKNMIFGTTTMHLMRKCPCPVWALKPGKDAVLSRILAAVDPDPFSGKDNLLNRNILELASSLAEMHDSELHVVHTWGFPVKSTIINNKYLDEMGDEIEKIHKSSFDTLVSRHVPDIPSTNVHLLEGEAGTQIARFAQENQIDCIVMGTVSRSGIPGLLMGNTAEKVLYRVNCSVLAVKPEGFVSPVEVEF